MPVYINPDFRRPPAGLGEIFAKSRQDSFFALPAWYALMARHGVPHGAEIRVYTDEQPGSLMALLARTTPDDMRRGLASLTNVHSLEHDLVAAPGTDRTTGLSAVLPELLGPPP